MIFYAADYDTAKLKLETEQKYRKEAKAGREAMKDRIIPSYGDAYVTETERSYIEKMEQYKKEHPKTVNELIKKSPQYIMNNLSAYKNTNEDSTIESSGSPAWKLFEN